MKHLKSYHIILILLFFNNGIFSQSVANQYLMRTHTNTKLSTFPMPYRLFVPVNYDPSKSYPLVMYLHGAGERGDDNLLAINGSRGATLWAESDVQAAHPCFVFVPQCNQARQWVNTPWSEGSYSLDKTPISDQLAMVVNILDSLPKEFNIDLSKVYITGYSMGGYATWDLIARFPNRFAAAIPICGGGDPSKTYLFGYLPIRTFHSDDDQVVPVSATRDMVNALKALGPNNRGNFYTEYTGLNHFCWETAYRTPGLVEWMFNAVPIKYTCENFIEGFALNITQASLIRTQELQLKVDLIPVNACVRDYKWVSLDPQIATVDQNGLVTALNKGSARIVVCTPDEMVRAQCNIDVLDFPVIPANQTPLIYDSFTNTTDKAVVVEGLSPADINIPGSNWAKCSGYSWADSYIEPVWGERPGTCNMVENGTGLGMSIASKDSYVKPSKIFVSAKINIIASQNANEGAIALGFYPQLPAKNIDQNGWVDNWANNFSGLRLVEDGSITIYEDGVKGETIAGTTPLTRGKFYTFSYCVDTNNGSISNILIEGINALYNFQTTSFTAANTMNVAFLTCGGQNNRGAMDDFKVSAINDVSTGIKNPALISSIRFFVPTTNRNIIQASEYVAKITLFSLDGKAMRSEVHSNKLDIGTIASGLYIVSAVDNEGMYHSSKIQICK